MFNISKENKHTTVNKPPQIQTALQFIKVHYNEKIYISDIAVKCGCSKVYLSKIFKSYTGMSVYTYLTEYRIKKAANLLKTGYSVSDACYNSGFNDCSKFIETFKKIIGTTPLKYKTDILKQK